MGSVLDLAFSSVYVRFMVLGQHNPSLSIQSAAPAGSYGARKWYRTIVAPRSTSVSDHTIPFFLLQSRLHRYPIYIWAQLQFW